MAVTPSATPWVGIDPSPVSNGAFIRWQDRICFGSDFPIIPYDYQAEVAGILDRWLPSEVERKIFSDNARRFLNLTHSHRE